MGLWNNHGMLEDREDCMDAIRALGLIPEEVMALADYAEHEAYVWGKMGQYAKAQEKRKANMIAKHWRWRCRRWKELAAYSELELSEMTEDDE